MWIKRHRTWSPREATLVPPTEQLRLWWICHLKWPHSSFSWAKCSCCISQHSVCFWLCGLAGVQTRRGCFLSMSPENNSIVFHPKWKEYPKQFANVVWMVLGGGRGRLSIFFCGGGVEINYFPLYPKDYISIQKSQCRHNSGDQWSEKTLPTHMYFIFPGSLGVRCESPSSPWTLTTQIRAHFTVFSPSKCVKFPDKTRVGW